MITLMCISLGAASITCILACIALVDIIVFDEALANKLRSKVKK